MKILLIDDVRTLASAKIARTFAEGISALRDEQWDVLLLDHDLGEEDGKDGTGIMNWLEENTQYLPKQITLVTSNPVGKERMQKIVDKLYREK